MHKLLKDISKNLKICSDELKKTRKIIREKTGTILYRKSQFENVGTEYSEYKTKVKFIKPNGETKWLDIENSEFEAIKKILLK